MRVDREAKEATVAHEEIPGFMAAMTMVFPVKDETALALLGPGAEITGTLAVQGADYWLEEVAVVKPAGAAGAAPTPAPHVEPSPGDPVPDVALVNQDGRPLRLADLRGKAVALTFIFTRCPLPEFCPRLGESFARVHDLLGRAGLLERTHLLSISFDTGFDTPKVLRSYGARFQKGASAAPAFSHWEFLTGKPDAVRQLATFFGLEFEEESGQFTHNLRTAVVDPQGRVVSVRRGSDWDPGGVVGDLERAVGSAR